MTKVLSGYTLEAALDPATRVWEWVLTCDSEAADDEVNTRQSRIGLKYRIAHVFSVLVY